MNTNKAVYWIILAAIAFGLSSEYHHGGFASVHRLAASAEARLCRAATHVEHALVAVGLLTSHSRPSPSSQSVTEQAAQIERAMDLHRAELDRALAEHQVEVERAEARLAHAQQALERARFGRMQVFETSHFKMMNDGTHRVITICPKSGRRIRLEADPDFAEVETDMPAIEVGDQF